MHSRGTQLKTSFNLRVAGAALALATATILSTPTTGHSALSCGVHPSSFYTKYWVFNSSRSSTQPATPAQCPAGGQAITRWTEEKQVTCINGTEIQVPSRVRVGVNVISDGNQYLEEDYNSSNMDALMQYFKASNLSVVAFRIIWSQMQPTENGPLNEQYLNRLKNFLDAADRHGISVYIDFHTLFNNNIYLIPSWWTETPGSPGNKSLIMIARDQVRQDQYLSLITRVLQPLAGKRALKYVSIMNEPWPHGWNDPVFDADMAGLNALFRKAANAARQAAPGIPVGIRFTSHNNPWAWQTANRFDETTVLDVFDWVGLNNYCVRGNVEASSMDPAKIQYCDEYFTTVQNARTALGMRGKKLWITEYGNRVPPQTYTSSKGFIEGNLDWYNEQKVDTVLIWNWQSSLTPPNTYNIANPSTNLGTVAFDALKDAGALSLTPVTRKVNSSVQLQCN